MNEIYPGNDFTLGTRPSGRPAKTFDTIEKIYWNGPEVAAILGIELYMVYAHRNFLGLDVSYKNNRLRFNKSQLDTIVRFCGLLKEGYSHKGAYQKLKSA